MMIAGGGRGIEVVLIGGVVHNPLEVVGLDPRVLVRGDAGVDLSLGDPYVQLLNVAGQDADLVVHQGDLVVALTHILLGLIQKSEEPLFFLW